MSLNIILLSIIALTNLFWIMRISRLQIMRADVIGQSLCTDALTGLPNRLSFRDRVTRAIEGGIQFGVLCLDIDRFDAINATLGQTQGDNLLRMVAERLCEASGPESLVARVGEDEYYIMCPVDAQQKMRQLVDRIMGAFEAPFLLAGMQIHVCLSIGASYYPTDGEDPEAVLRSASIALSLAKSRGKGCFCEYTKCEDRQIGQLQAENRLRQAILNNELVVHYQPQFSLATGQLIGVEALVRWQHPDRGLVYPGEFIPLAEETGLIVKLNEYVLREACRQRREWLDEGYGNFRVAVNLTARQLLRADLAEKICEVLQETGLSPNYLELEIPENLVMVHAEHTEPILKALRAKGITVALDDFGTGYSSLSYLRMLPLDTLKIDRAFIQGATENPYDAAITAAAIAIAEVRGLSVIAEGVETKAQEQFLAQLQCQASQGFLFSRPIPAASLKRDVLRKNA